MKNIAAKKQGKSINTILFHSLLHTLLGGFVISILLLVSWVSIEYQASINANKELITNIIMRDIDNLLTSHAMGDTEASVFQLKYTVERLPISCAILVLNNQNSNNVKKNLTIINKSNNINTCSSDMTIRLESGGIYLGDLSVDVLSGINTFNVIMKAFFILIISIIISILTWVVIIHKIRKTILTPVLDIIERLKENGTPYSDRNAANEIQVLISALVEAYSKLRESSKFSAIASTTQMLAHDVRKPFTILQGIIAVLDDAKDISDFKSKLPQMLDTVQRSITSVDGLIKDVLEIGRSDNILPEPTSLQTLYEIFLNDLAKVYTYSEVELESEFKTFVYANVETNKVLRVFLNIAGNAIEAMNNKGKLWFKTDIIRIEEKPFIEFRIGNNGPPIPLDVIPQLFESFYTSGKKGGTGLGLAIAKKIVEAHGGLINCESGNIKGTEFIFTLPALIDRVSESFSLNNTLKEYQKSSQSLVSIEDKESRYEREILAKITNTDAKIKVLLVDDEAIYRQTLVKLLTLNSDIASHLEILHAENSSGAYEKLEHLQVDIVILDIDLGKNSENGLEIAATLNRNKFPGKICIHSNRFLSSNHVANLKVDMITRKPMDRVDILELISSAIEKLPLATKILGDNSFHIAVVEDNEAIMYLMRKQLCSYAEVHHYFTPEYFLEDFPNKSFDMVITDQNFDPLSCKKGLDLVRYLRNELNYQKPIILASLEDFSEGELLNLVDGTINKNCFLLKDIERYIPMDKLGSAGEYKRNFQADSLSAPPDIKDVSSLLQDDSFAFARKRIPHSKLTEKELSLLAKIRHDIFAELSLLYIYFENVALKKNRVENISKIKNVLINVKPFCNKDSHIRFELSILKYLEDIPDFDLFDLQNTIYDLQWSIRNDDYYKWKPKSDVGVKVLEQRTGYNKTHIIVMENDDSKSIMEELIKTSEIIDCISFSKNDIGTAKVIYTDIATALVEECSLPKNVRVITVNEKNIPEAVYKKYFEKRQMRK